MTVTNGPTMHFYYDAQDKPAQVNYNGIMYRYVHNQQGDIIAIVDSAGNTVVQYAYHSEMDYHNNAIGRQIALDLGKHASDEELMKACYT